MTLTESACIARKRCVQLKNSLSLRLNLTGWWLPSALRGGLFLLAGFCRTNFSLLLILRLLHGLAEDWHYKSGLRSFFDFLIWG